jgi:hypothetical protein
MALLGVDSRSTYYDLLKRARESREVKGLSKDQLDRLSYLLGIYEAIRVLFPHSEESFSSLILTGQMTREEALERIAKPAYDPDTIAQDFEYVATKLDISVNELKALMQLPKRSYRDYQNKMSIIDLGTKIMRAIGVQRALMR